ncbi:MAG: hypothetical protein IPN07_16805 [Dehalococcoidia bacterium]|nr:hypothetical protein [Dehalococcoidia bacterium]
MSARPGRRRDAGCPWSRATGSWKALVVIDAEGLAATPPTAPTVTA